MPPLFKKIAVFAAFSAFLFLSDFLKAQTNQDPVITSNPPTQVWNDEAYQYIISTYDADGEAVIITAPTLPGWLSLQTDPGGLVTTFAGSGTQSYAGGSATDAAFSRPAFMAFDSEGTLYLSDEGNDRIRKISPDGYVSQLSIIQSPITGFWSPSGLAFDSQGNLYVGDVGVIRKISPDGSMETFAGKNGEQGFANGTGTDARFFNVYGLTIDSNDNLYAVDNGLDRIRKITPLGVVSTFAGSGSGGSADGIGTEASFFIAHGITIDGNDNLYIADTNNNRIRKITPAGIVSTIAGSGNSTDEDGTGTLASFDSPFDISIDSEGNLYVTTNSHNIRKIDTQLSVTTIVGTGTAGFQNGRSIAATLNFPRGIIVDKSANIFVADGANNVIRKISAPGYILSGDATGQSGSHSVSLLASDGNGGTGTQVFDVLANDVAEPRFVSSPVLTVDEEQEYVYLLKAEDRNGGSLKFSASLLPAWLTLETYEKGVVSTIAGAGARSFQDGTATSALFYNPNDLVLDQSGNIYVVDTENDRIRKITSDGVVSTLAGASRGSADGIGTDAEFNRPTGIDIDASGVLYVVDQYNHRIRKVNSAGVVSTFAGSGFSGFGDGAAEQAVFNYPRGIALDTEGNAYVTDVSNNRIRKISPDGTVTTLAGSRYSGDTDGTGTDARFRGLFDIDIDSHGNLFVTEHGNKVIRKVTAAGTVTTFAGSGSSGQEDGTGTRASFFYPAGITIDSSDNVYITDKFGYRIRKVSPDAVVSTVAGSGTKGHSNGTGSEAAFSTPTGITVDSDGNLYLTDSFDGYIRKVSFDITTLIGDPLGKLGNHNVTLKASDDGDNFTEQSFTISVVDVMPPVFTSAIDTDFLSLGEVPAVIIETTDRNSVSYSLEAVMDESLFLIDPTSGAISFATPPDFQNPGDSDKDNVYQITVKATDGSNEASQQINITVIESSSNLNPVISSTPEVRVWNNESYEYLIAAYDPDGDLVSVAATTLPSWLSLTKDPGGLVTTYAGSGNNSFAEGPLTSASFNYPNDIAIDNEGNFYVSDQNNSRIRKISTEGIVSTLAGSGAGGSADGIGTEADIPYPQGIAVDNNGNVYVATGNLIRKVAADSQVTTLVGSTTSGYADGIGTNALFSSINGMTTDADNNLYVTDVVNYRIRKEAV